MSSSLQTRPPEEHTLLSELTPLSIDTGCEGNTVEQNLAITFVSWRMISNSTNMKTFSQLCRGEVGVITDASNVGPSQVR